MTTAKLVSREDAAAALGVSIHTVDRLRSSGQLHTFRVRGRAMVTVASLERYLGLADDATTDTATSRRPRWDGFEIPGLDEREAA